MFRPMFRLLSSILFLTFLPLAAHAQQELSALARVEVGNSQVTDRWGGGVSVELSLTQGVPYRAYTLSEPNRLVLDFREVDWTGVTKDVLLNADRASDLRFGRMQRGWSRLVVDLVGPLAIDQAEMTLNPETGQAFLQVQLEETTVADFTQKSGAPIDLGFGLPEPVARAVTPPKDGDIVVVLDAGHGGIDPGAEREGYSEKNLMLTFARELQETLRRSGGFTVHLTREEDAFVSLERRVALAHELSADVFLSLHADALAEGQARGATVYVLSDSASDKASQLLAERHDRDDLLSGVDLTGQDDVVADVLMDLARQETTPRTDRLARHLVSGMKNAQIPVNKRPLRQAGFSVLKAADIPSVLIEVGFMSDSRDLKNLANKQWRISVAASLRDALRKWQDEDQARAGLVRQ